MDTEQKKPIVSAANENQRMVKEKQKAKAKYEQTLTTLGNLTVPEVEELVGYEFEKLDTLDGQIRRYYLKLKSEKPERAEQMLSDLEGIKLDESASEEDISKICGILGKYWSGYVIDHNGKTYNSREIKTNK